MGKNKFVKRMILFIISILVISSPMIGRISYAASGKSIVISSHSYNEENKKIYIPGAKFYLYKVGDYDGNKYVIKDEFRNSWVDINSSSAKVEMDSADKLYKYVNENNIKGRLEITDSNGKAVFSGLSDGVYMIAQKGEVKIGNMIYKSNPFLVKSPNHFEEESSIVVEPKYGITTDGGDDSPTEEDNPPNNDDPTGDNNPPSKNPPDKGGKPPTNVKTGDEGILSTIALFIVALVMFIIVNKKKKKQ